MSEQDPDGAGPAFEVPHDLRAEQLLLGTTMRSKDAVADVVEILRPASFYRVAHELIYNAVLELYAAGESTDPIKVAAKLTEQGLLARSGGRDYLHRLVNMVRSTAEAETLALLVEDKALRRRLIETATRIDRLAHADAPTADLVDTIQAEVHAVTVGHSPSWVEARPMADVMEGVLDEVEGIGSYIGAPAGVPTGLSDLDALTNGLHPGQLIVLGSRPAHGKSTLALTILRACSFRNGLPAVIYSLEMGRNEIGMRLLSAESRVPLHHMRSGNMTDRDWTRAATRMPEVSSAPLFIDDAPNLTLAEIRSKSRRLKAQHGIKLIVVDYVQLLDHGRHKYGSRYEDVNEVSRRLKLLAKELQVPVIALSQLNRAPEQRADKRPHIYDLRDSGTLEDDADLVVLLHREDAYAADNRPGEADLIVAKHRNGPTAIITVAFHPTISAFTDPGDRGFVPHQADDDDVRPANETSADTPAP
ncbi:replicative DNA helicase [Kitasatospora aureofaciens]|uniref:replicative DNA helicase n=1 Tax=Kitasatospora aureofaciens TaxID=1894 RepID=UPI0034015057